MKSMDVISIKDNYIFKLNIKFCTKTKLHEISVCSRAARQHVRRAEEGNAIMQSVLILSALIFCLVLLLSPAPQIRPVPTRHLLRWFLSLRPTGLLHPWQEAERCCSSVNSGVNPGSGSRGKLGKHLQSVVKITAPKLLNFW